MFLLVWGSCWHCTIKLRCALAWALAACVFLFLFVCIKNIKHEGIPNEGIPHEQRLRPTYVRSTRIGANRGRSLRYGCRKPWFVTDKRAGGGRQARGSDEEGGRTGAASEGKRRRGQESGGGRRGRGREAMAEGGGEAVNVRRNKYCGRISNNNNNNKRFLMGPRKTPATMKHACGQKKCPRPTVRIKQGANGEIFKI